MLISLIINCDTRPERNNDNGLFNGVVDRDFLTDGILNKQLFFKGFDIETIVFIDKIEEIPTETLDYLYQICTTVVVRKHTEENKFNDNNYVSALSLARGEIICHVDQDVNLFTNYKESVQGMINLLDNYDYVCYPSHWSPNPTHDPRYDYYWASTRFFFCKRETLDITEIKKCLSDSDYLYGKYPASVRTPWTEHICALISKYTGKGVFYPPIEMDKRIVFTWSSYKKGVIKKLNESSYDDVKKYVEECGNIQYPVDIKCL
jgi:hypothetical protein